MRFLLKNGPRLCDKEKTTLQKHRETLTENDIEELISETVKLKEIQVPAAPVAGWSQKVVWALEFLWKLYPLEVSTLAGKYSLGGIGGCQKFRDLKCQKMSLLDAVCCILLCG